MINKLLEKPESYRRKVAFVATGVIGFVVIAVWLTITNYNMKQALAPDASEVKIADSFRQNLPSLRQTETVQTELSKQQAAKSGGVVTGEKEQKVIINEDGEEVLVEEKKSFWAVLFGK